MAWKKILRETPDGRFLFRPWGQFGRAWELPDRAAYQRARLVNYGMIVLIMAVVIANLAHRQTWITVAVAAALVVGFFVWMAIEKKSWKPTDEE